jgi:hypothetical protein
LVSYLHENKALLRYIKLDYFLAFGLHRKRYVYPYDGYISHKNNLGASV